MLLWYMNFGALYVLVYIVIHDTVIRFAGLVDF